ncbi:MAG TPA: ABC transporter substrate-binding protein [Burkholderiaceae bacterium]|jgi:branched-chain amino acid transport system substrate-binding protein|nr:ABC transporter substrate-binding protein [Burkholderiaceae bacterium]HRP27556.1 ABC transporter substrate-binding protein [Burkholderiaceae bacterium]
MSKLTRREFNQMAAASAVAGTLAAPALVRAQPKTLKVGVLLPRSGTQAFIGQSCQLGADISPGLIREMYGVDLELMNADTETNVEVARSRAEKLINDGAQVLVGPFDSGAAAAIAQVAEQRKIPFIVNIAAAPQITEQGYKYTVRNFPTAVDLIHNGLALMRDLFQATNTAPRKAVFMHVNDTFGTSMVKGIGAILPKLDYLPFKVVETISYDPAARDLSVEVAKAKATNADFIMLVSRLNDAILLVRELVKQRWSPQGIISPGSPGMYEAQFYKALGNKYSDYAISNVPWYNPNAALTKRVEAAFAKQFPKEKMMFHALNVGFTFEAMMIAADAFKRAGSADGAALNDAIHKTDITERMMVGGPIKFDAKGQNTQIASACIQNRNGQPVVVLPKDAAQMAPVYPVPNWQARG